jgi:pyrimidine-nucleoside phosphorylase
MSKKLAAGADALVLDVKSGDGAFLKSREEAVQLGHTMVSIGKGAGKKTVALITSMEQPLGCAIGNALEVREAIQTLRGEGPEDLAELCFTLGGWMLTLAGLCDGPGQGRSILIKKITEGAALAKFAEMVVSQHGNGKVAEDLAILPVADKIIRVKASRTGYVERLKAEAIGVAAMTLGAGREKKDSKIDPAAGIVLEKKLGDPVKSGETLAVLHLSKKLPAEHVDIARELVLSAYSLGSNPVQVEPLVNGVIE